MKSFTEAQREQRLKDLANTFDQKVTPPAWHKPVEALRDYQETEVAVSLELYESNKVYIQRLRGEQDGREND